MGVGGVTRCFFGLLAFFAFSGCVDHVSRDGGGSGGTVVGSGGSGDATVAGGSGGVDVGTLPLTAADQEWLDALGPRTGPHEVWTRDQCADAAPGTTSERVGEEYQVVPTQECGRDRGDLTDHANYCSIRPYCTTSADCTEGPGGRCEGVVEPSYCHYPDVFPEPCRTDADCGRVPGGYCPEPGSYAFPTCYPSGHCLVPPPYCAYDSLYQLDCQSDSDCTAAPGGECILPIRYTSCAYDTCSSDDDCEEGTRCGCGRCEPADCASDAECADGETCAFNSPYCGYPSGFHCTSPEDECEPSDSGCYYEDGRFVVLIVLCE